jgi:hypothetical protein
MRLMMGAAASMQRTAQLCTGDVLTQRWGMAVGAQA